MTIKEAIEVLKENKVHYYTSCRKQAMDALLHLAQSLTEEGKLEGILLGTCEKELDETIGFMLTEKEANIFATAIRKEMGGGNEVSTVS